MDRIAYGGMALGENVRLLGDQGPPWGEASGWEGHLKALVVPRYACAHYYAERRAKAGTTPSSCAEEHGPPTEWKRGGSRAASG